MSVVDRGLHEFMLLGVGGGGGGGGATYYVFKQLIFLRREN